MIAPAVDEVLASLQHLRRVQLTGGSVWRAFWGRGRDAGPDPGRRVARAVLGYGGPAAASDRVAGPVVIAVGIVAASTITRGLRWANLVPGLWLLAGPALLGVPAGALASSLAAGVLVLALTPWGPGDSERFGGGWRGLFDPSRLAGTVGPAADGRRD